MKTSTTTKAAALALAGWITWLMPSALHAQSGAILALQLDGVDDYAQAGHRPEFNAFPLTVTAWIKTTQNTAGAAGIVGKYVANSLNGYQVFLFDGRVRAWYFRDNANFVMTGQLGLDGGFVADDLWHHVAFVADQTGGKLYVDGVLRDSLAWTGTPGACTTITPLRIGLYNLYLAGQIDDVTLWQAALTASEVAWMRSRKLDGQEPGLVRYYRFNSGFGATLENSAGLTFVGEDIFGIPQWVESTAPIIGLGPDRALRLTISAHRVEVPHAADLNAYPLATTCWLRTTQSDGIERRIVGKYVAGSSNGYQLLLKDGRVRAWYYRSAANRIQTADAQGLDGGFIADGNWHHLAFVVTSFGGELYVDGILRANQPWTGAPGAPSTTAPLVFGGGLIATLDEVTLWNRDLRSLPFGTNSLSGISEPGLIGYWRLDERSAIAPDSSPFSHTGEVTSSGVPDTSTVPIDPPSPFTRPATSVTATSARLSGTVLPQPHGLPYSAWFQWGLTTSYGNQTLLFPGSGTTNVSVTNVLSGLIPGTNYHFRLTILKSGRQAFGADHTFSTPPLPPLVTTLAVTNRGSTNAVLRGSVNPLGLAGTEAWFEWGLTASLGNTTATQQMVSTATFPFDQMVQQLSPGTTYYFQANARNIGGQGEGSILSFTTLLLPQAVTLPATDLTPNTALLQGTVDPGGVPGTVVWFEWGTTAALGNTSIVQTLTVTNGISVSQLIMGLAQNTLHHYRVVAQSAAGEARGSVRTFTTPGAPSVSRRSPMNVGATNATLAGVVDPNGFPATAWFEWGTTTNYGNATAPVNAGSGTAFVTLSNLLTGLNVHQEYHYRIVASNVFGVSYSLDVSFRTALFAQVGAGLHEYRVGGSVWGDFDGDGDLDFLMAGAMGVPFTVVTDLYQNNGGVFVNTGLALQGVDFCSLSWADFDNDGDLDCLIAGLSNNIPVSRLYRNTGGSLVRVDGLLNILPGFSRGAAAWGDSDNDGDLDLALIGVGAGSARLTRLVRNDAGFLTNIVSLTNLAPGTVTWTDYDGDADLDLFVSGSYADALSYVQRLYRNDLGRLTNVVWATSGVFGQESDWGDYDNDGDLDLWLGNDFTGGNSTVFRNNGAAQFTSPGLIPENNLQGHAWGDYDNDGDLDLLLGPAVYRNDAGVFTNAQVGLPSLGVYDGASWGDYDNDGRLDILIHSEFPGVSGVYRSFAATSNTPPLPPQGLQAMLSSNRVDLSWNPATDDHTPALGLTYNLRVGLTPSGVEVVSPHSDPVTGFRRLVQMGNAQLGTNAWLTSIQPNRPYFWSVQAVDGAFAGGPFATEARFAYATTNVGPVTSTSATVQPGQNVVLGFSGTAGVTYTIEASTDLIEWRAIGVATANASGDITFVDVGGGTAEQRYYRTAFP